MKKVVIAGLIGFVLLGIGVVIVTKSYAAPRKDIVINASCYYATIPKEATVKLYENGQIKQEKRGHDINFRVNQGMRYVVCSMYYESAPNYKSYWAHKNEIYNNIQTSKSFSSNVKMYNNTMLSGLMKDAQLQDAIIHEINVD